MEDLNVIEYRCEYCFKKVKDEKSLANHIEVCNVTLELSSNLMLICDYCGKKRENFSSSRAFLNHYRDHKGEEYPCGQCNKTFSTKQNLRYHKVK